MVVWNPTKELVSTKMQGAWFTFKPDMRKNMDEEKCRFITECRKETGLVVLPSPFDPLSDDFVEGFDKTDDGKAILEKKAEEGIRNLLAYHREVIKNNQVSLRKDLSKVNPTGDPARMLALEMSEGERKSLELVAKYQRSKQDDTDARVKDIASLLDAVGPMAD